MKKPWVLSYPLSAQRRLWSDWADAQADLSLRWAHSHFVDFVMSRLISYMVASSAYKSVDATTFWKYKRQIINKRRSTSYCFLEPAFRFRALRYSCSTNTHRQLLQNRKTSHRYCWFANPTSSHYIQELGSLCEESPMLSMVGQITSATRPLIHLLHSISQYCYEEEVPVCYEGEGPQI